MPNHNTFALVFELKWLAREFVSFLSSSQWYFWIRPAWAMSSTTASILRHLVQSIVLPASSRRKKATCRKRPWIPFGGGGVKAALLPSLSLKVLTFCETLLSPENDLQRRHRPHVFLASQSGVQ